MNSLKDKIVKLSNGFYLKKIFGNNLSGIRRLLPVKSLLSQAIFLFIVVFVALKAVSYFFSFMNAPIPTLSLQFPKEDQITTGEKAFIKGVITPVSSEVFANGQKVAKNGDGSFTAVISIPEGRSTLKVEALYRGKKAEILRLVTRQLTQEELQIREEEKRKKELEAREDTLKTDQKIDDLLSTYNKGATINAVTVLDNKLEDKFGFKSITGKVINNTSEKVYWVKVTATFYDANNNIVDSKSGFAVSLDQVLESGRAANFKTQSTTKAFSYYKATVDWKTNSAIGGADISTQIEDKKASSSPKPL